MGGSIYRAATRVRRCAPVALLYMGSGDCSTGVGWMPGSFGVLAGQCPSVSSTKLAIGRGQGNPAPTQRVAHRRWENRKTLGWMRARHLMALTHRGFVALALRRQVWIWGCPYNKGIFSCLEGVILRLACKLRFALLVFEERILRGCAGGRAHGCGQRCAYGVMVLPRGGVGEGMVFYPSLQGAA